MTTTPWILALAGAACLLTAATPPATAAALVCVDLDRIIVVQGSGLADVAAAPPSGPLNTANTVVVVAVRCQGLPGAPSPLNPEGCTMTLVRGAQQAEGALVGGTYGDSAPGRAAAFGLVAAERAATEQFARDAPGGPLAAAHAYGDRLHHNAVAYGDAALVWALAYGPQAQARAEAFAAAVRTDAGAYLACI